MAFILDEAEENSQGSPPVRRHCRKRRRLNSSPALSQDHSASESIPDEYDLPSNGTEDFIEVDDTEDWERHHSKYDAVIHQPAFVESQPDVFLTQADQPWSSPTRIRGPQWKKKTVLPVPAPALSKSNQTPRANTLRNDSFPKPATASPVVVDEFDDDELDALLAEGNLDVTGAVILPSNIEPQESVQARQPQSKSFRQTTLFGTEPTRHDVSSVATQPRAHNWPLAQVQRNEALTHHKIKIEAMQRWTYPLNVGEIREYQFNIVHKALFANLLVALPTGLGKTFIAATVMMNWFNWTSEAQIVFLAPTKPLVSQQIDACFHIAGIPRTQTTLLTGEISAAVRADEWQEKRVFFMTPQTLINDLKSGYADPKKIVLIVFDEAHKATGGYSYVEVVKFVRRFNSSFRVLALTATPGASVEAVQKVVDGLDIARVEIRTEESLDIRDFVHRRNIDLELFDNSDEMSMCLDLFGASVKSVVDKLCQQNAYWKRDPLSITLFGLMKAREQWFKSEAGRRADQGVKGMMHACFTPLMTLAHNLELLKYHGVGPFYHKMKIFEEETGRGKSKYGRAIVEHEDFRKLMNRLRGWCNDDNFVGHPKLTYLKSVVLNHFMDAGDGTTLAVDKPASDTRIMIFAHYRDSAEEITRVLNRHRPMIRAHVFVGQSGTKGSEGMDQKTQIDIIAKFKAGTYNTLVATSIGEEGLDIGEVDLIVCYDCSKSPIRMLQRMGRTGRKRAGHIVLLLMRGKEENDYYSAKDNYEKMQDIIESGRQFSFHDDRSPRIVPRAIQPQVDKRHVEIPLENTQPGSVEPKKRKSKAKKKPAKKFHMPDGVETGFTFLGDGKKGKGKKTVQKEVEMRQKPKPILIDLDVASLPDLENVLLSPEQEDELNEKYAQIAGTEPQFVQQIEFNRHPQKLFRRGKTRRVQHSSTTTRLVKASKAIRDLPSDCQSPPASHIICAFPQESRIEEDDRQPQGQAISRPVKSVPASNGKERHPNKPSHCQVGGMSDDEDQYDLNDSFVNDGNDDDGASTPPATLLSRRRGHDGQKTTSHSATQISAPSRDDFPSLSQQSDRDLGFISRSTNGNHQRHHNTSNKHEGESAAEADGGSETENLQPFYVSQTSRHEDNSDSEFGNGVTEGLPEMEDLFTSTNRLPPPPAATTSRVSRRAPITRPRIPSRSEAGVGTGPAQRTMSSATQAHMANHKASPRTATGDGIADIHRKTPQRGRRKRVIDTDDEDDDDGDE